MDAKEVAKELYEMMEKYGVDLADEDYLRVKELMGEGRNEDAKCKE